MLTDEDLSKQKKHNQILEILKLIAFQANYFNYVVKFLKLHDLALTEESLIEHTRSIENPDNTVRIKRELTKVAPKQIQTLYDELINLSNASGYAVKQFNHDHATPIAPSDTFNPLLAMFRFANPEIRGFFDNIFSVFNRVKISLNPQMSLNSDERKQSKYGDLFVELARYDQGFNAMFRNFLEKNYTDEQMLYGVLKELNNRKLTITRDKLFNIVEQEILTTMIGSNKITTKGIEAQIADKINDNLMTILRRRNFILPESTAEQKSAYLNQIQSIKSIIQYLVIKIQDQEKQLAQLRLVDPTACSRENKLAIYKLIQDHKKKLYHFLLKTTAWTKQHTLDPTKNFNYFRYFEEQFKKFPNGKSAVITFTPPTVGAAALASDPELSTYTFAAAKPNKGILKLFKLDDKELVNQADFTDTLQQEQNNWIALKLADEQQKIQHLEIHLNAKLSGLEKINEQLEQIYALFTPASPSSSQPRRARFAKDLKSQPRRARFAKDLNIQEIVLKQSELTEVCELLDRYKELIENKIQEVQVLPKNPENLSEFKKKFTELDSYNQQLDPYLQISKQDLPKPGAASHYSQPYPMLTS